MVPWPCDDLRAAFLSSNAGARTESLLEELEDAVGLAGDDLLERRSCVCDCCENDDGCCCCDLPLLFPV